MITEHRFEQLKSFVMQNTSHTYVSSLTGCVGAWDENCGKCVVGISDVLDLMDLEKQISVTPVLLLRHSGPVVGSEILSHS